MSVKTIAAVATGDMGHAVGGALIEHGFRVVIKPFRTQPAFV